MQSKLQAIMDVNSKYWDAETYLTLIKDVPIVRSWWLSLRTTLQSYVFINYLNKSEGLNYFH